MAEPCYERYPLAIVVPAAAHAIATYVLAAAILARIAAPLAAVATLYFLWLEYRVLTQSCSGCYYYGRLCAFGRGKLAALLVARTDPALFAARTVSWRDVLPDLLVLAVPLVAGIVLLILRFEWSLAAMLAALVLLSTAGNAVIRGRFACRHCQQREIGCPAQKLFEAR